MKVKLSVEEAPGFSVRQRLCRLRIPNEHFVEYFLPWPRHRVLSVAVFL